MAAVLVATVVVDVTRFEPTTTGHLRVALLQGDDEQLPLAQQINQPLTEKHFALAEQLHGDYDLIVFPESALDTDPEIDPELRARLVALAEEHDSAVLVNARTPGDDGQSRNTNLLYTPDGTLQGIYSKQHLVPFGEYVPWRDALSWLARAAPGARTTSSPATRRTLFHAGGHPFESVICFESAFGPLVRDATRDGAQLIVVSTNNRSYQRSANSEQHLALGQMRAAETGTRGAAGIGVGHQRGDRPRRHRAPQDRAVRGARSSAPRCRRRRARRPTCASATGSCCSARHDAGGDGASRSGARSRPQPVTSPAA